MIESALRAAPLKGKPHLYLLKRFGIVESWWRCAGVAKANGKVETATQFYGGTSILDAEDAWIDWAQRCGSVAQMAYASMILAKRQAVWDAKLKAEAAVSAAKAAQLALWLDLLGDEERAAAEVLMKRDAGMVLELLRKRMRV